MNHISEKSIEKKLKLVMILSGSIFVCLCFLLCKSFLSPVEKPQEENPVVEKPVEKPESDDSPTVNTDEHEIIADNPVVIDVKSDDSLQRIVNMTFPISGEYVPADLTVPNVVMYETQQLRKEASDAIEEMFASAEADGIHLSLISGYRDYTMQKSLWYTYVDRYGIAAASRMDAYPGACEHQLGLLADIGTEDDNCTLQGCFAYSTAYSWLLINAPKFGFVERYGKNMEDSTGIAYTPWNFRYIGSEEALKVSESGLSLEEYYANELSGK